MLSLLHSAYEGHEVFWLGGTAEAFTALLAEIQAEDLGTALRIDHPDAVDFGLGRSSVARYRWLPGPEGERCLRALILGKIADVSLPMQPPNVQIVLERLP